MTICMKAIQLMKEFAGKTLFEQVDLEIHHGERVALYGRNGLGKTTLLRILAGAVQPDDGRVERRLSMEEWGWMEPLAEEEVTIPTLEFVRMGSPAHNEALRSLKAVEVRMKDASAELETLFAVYQEVSERYLQLDGYEWESRVERMLLRLGLGSELWELPLSSLSGGQKTRAQLARLMVREPQLLLLDEPTNHLDGESLDILEAWLQAYPGTVVFVSHDRQFIDRVATCLYELTPTGCRRYKGGYTEITRQKELERRTQEALYRKQQLMREQLEESIRMYRQWFHQGEKSARQAEVPIQRGYFQARAGTHISRMNAKMKELGRLEADNVEQPRDPAQLKLSLGASEFASSTLVRLSQAAFSYGGDRELLAGVSFSVDRGIDLPCAVPTGRANQHC
ncbi:ATP-binding cassette domain-containing protein [Paenibacillus hexagrammi]|uniref:ATP-binding cassette domain-containing protein n=1 Tax=Paenibacillus hexagrammi TaxID=2908839 RepID=A0ABY3SMX5_9BACL|nr:ATP-binding cassette domain-containing protein [Paenibacillus sp. YPD9-1]UJF35291.1 ATP-binding cassette domain-containing protein [Paenibacillus sp. YPD9-1]